MSTQELQVITKAKELTKYVLIVTDKSNRRYKYTLVEKVVNISIDMISDMYKSNGAYLGKRVRKSSLDKRMSYQLQAIGKINLIEYLMEELEERGCILEKEKKHIDKLIYELEVYLSGWIKDTERRLELIEVK